MAESVNTTEHAVHFLKTKLKAERPANQQQLNETAVKAKHIKGQNPAFSHVHEITITAKVFASKIEKLCI